MNLTNAETRGRPALLPLLLALSLAVGCEQKPSGNDTAKPTGQRKIGYVLHGLNEFTQIIKQGAEDAARAESVTVNVAGPAGFATADAIAMFEGMAQKPVDGLVVVPMPGEVWVTPIRQATQAGIPVLTANITSPGSTATTWFGQDEYASGVILATELRKFLTAQSKHEGRIVVGMCAPGVGVLVERYEGFKKGMSGTKFQITQPFDVNTENTANYAAWENLAGANPEMAAIVGLCSMDLPNLAKLKERTKGHWLVAGYDLGRETLDAVKAGTIQVAVGQHPYLQGYLPVVALARHLRDKQPLPQGWIDVGTEVVTRDNVELIYGRETDARKQTQWYASYVAKQFADLNAAAKPLPKSKN
ncbi:MAG: sugar ABC transporter substrate-binding protein [Pedosphaera sp.]|nr:sugar ABC transporter substrate-binding protein [Pedosphaera sp.]